MADEDIKEYDVGDGIDVLLKPHLVSRADAVRFTNNYASQIGDKIVQIDNSLKQNPINGKESEDPTKNKQLQFWNTLFSKVARLNDSWESLEDDRQIDVNPLRLLMLQNGLLDLSLLEALVTYNLEENSYKHSVFDVRDLINLLEEVYK